MDDRPRAFDLVVLAPLGFAALAYQLAEPGEIIPPIAMIACIAGRAIQDLTGWVLGRTAIAVAVAIAILYVIADIARIGLEVTLFADFMMILAALKAFERRTPRDDGQLLVVSIFVALSAAVSSNRMGTGVLLVVYVFSLMLAVMRVQVDSALWPDRAKKRDGLWTLLTGCVLGSTAVAVVAFVLLPRTNVNIAPALSPSTQRVSGFRESIDLGSGGLISQSPQEVMRVSIVDRQSEEDPLPFDDGAVVYLRGRVLSEYERGGDGGRWNPVADGSLWTSTRVGEGTFVTVGGAVDRRTYRIIQHAGASGSGTVFSVWKPSGLSFAVGTGRVQRHLQDSSLRFEEPPGVTLDYRVTFGRDETYRV